MIVASTSDLLNILIPNDNKVLKEVLKEADLKTLGGTSSKQLDVPNIIKNLFNDVLTENKASQTINNLLQNSNIVKELGSFSSSVQNLVQTLPLEPEFSEIKSFLQKFLVNVENMDESNLKQQIVKSGIFLESKIDHAINPNKALSNILEDIKEVIKDIKTPLAKELSTLVNKVLDTIKEASSKPISTPLVAQENKADLNKIQDLLKNILSSSTTPKVNDKINNILTQIQGTSNTTLNLQNNSKTLETQNLKTQLTNNATTILNTIKNELQALSPNLQTQTGSLKQVDSMPEIKTSAPLTKMDITQQVKSSNTLNTSSLNSSLLNTSSLNTITSPILSNINESLNNTSTVQNTNISNTSTVNANTSNTNTQALNTTANTNNNETIKSVISEIDNLIKNNSFFNKSETSMEPKNVLSNVIQLVKAEAKLQNNQNLNIDTNKALNNLQNILGEIKTSEVSLLNNKTLESLPSDTLKNLQTNLSLLKEGLSSSTSTKTIDTLINKLSNINNLFTKIPLEEATLNSTLKESIPSTFTSNFTNNMNSIITSLKSSFVENNNVLAKKTLSPLLNKLENIINLKVKENIDVNSFLKNDLKASLLQVQAELSNNHSASESLKHVDKLLTQIDYYQLLSINNNSNHVYLPFLWDLLEDGSISVKETKDKKFFCEINLSLKEFGNVNLLLSLYDKNHLDISAFASNNNFKELVKEHMSELRSSLTKAGLKAVNIKILDLDKKEKTKDEVQVNQYTNTNDNLDFKVDIRV